MKQLSATILANDKVAEDFYRMRIESAYLAGQAKPGRFVEVRCSDRLEPLLRRPLGIHRIRENGIEMLYEIVGAGTAILVEKKAGAALDILGPLGNGFELPVTSHQPLATILIAGGVGVAPLMALAEELSRRSPVAGRRKVNVDVIIGAKTKSHILCDSDFRALGCAVSVVTEDGSRGKKGLATDLLKSLLETGDPRPVTIYACGPTPMLKAVAEIARKDALPCQVSLEEHMACGVGVCLGCPVRMKTGGYKMVCKDGPVFNAEDIVW